MEEADYEEPSADSEEEKCFEAPLTKAVTAPLPHTVELLRENTQSEEERLGAGERIAEEVHVLPAVGSVEEAASSKADGRETLGTEEGAPRFTLSEFWGKDEEVQDNV